MEEEFNLGDQLTLKAATAMPGIALRGETCGTIIGGLMAIGLEFGRQSLDEPQNTFQAIAQGRKFCHRFEQEFGSVDCSDVIKVLTGKSYNLADPQQVKEFVASGDVQKCRAPQGRAARFVGELIMEKRG